MIIVPLKQERKQSCGVAALRMIMLAHGKDVSEKELIKKLGGLKSYGTTIVALAKLTSEYGFKSFCLTCNRRYAKGAIEYAEPSREILKSAISRYCAVVVPLRAAIFYDEPKQKRRGHMILITKCEGNKVFYVDPYDGREHDIDEDRFLFAWYNMAAENSAYMLSAYQ